MVAVVKLIQAPTSGCITLDGQQRALQAFKILSRGAVEHLDISWGFTVKQSAKGDCVKWTVIQKSL